MRDGLSPGEIAERLNAKQVKTEFNNIFTRQTVRRILSNEKYIGNNIYNRHSYKLKKQRITNPEEIMIRKPGAFLGIISVDLYDAAQEVLARRASHLSNDEMLDKLRSLHQEKGNLTSALIEQSEDLPYPSTYASRFGSLNRAFELIGFDSRRDMRYVAIAQRMRELQISILECIHRTILERGGVVWKQSETDILQLGSELAIGVVLLRCHTLPNGLLRWRSNLKFPKIIPDIVVMTRLNESNTQILDYYIVPKQALHTARLNITERAAHDLECFRHVNLDFLYTLTSDEAVKRA